MNITVKKSTREEHILLQNKYYASVIAPLDDMWELGIIAKATYYSIYDEQLIGYLVLNHDNTLLQFVLISHYECEESDVFQACLNQLKIKKAFACTYEPNYLGLCLEVSKTHSLDGILFDHVRKEFFEKPYDNLCEHVATMKDLDRAIAYTTDDIDMGGEWLEPYYLYLLESNSLYLYTLDDVIIGTGEIRPTTTYYKAANIGMTVSTKNRQKSLGSYILNRMVEVAYNQGLQPICGTDAGNLPSQKTIKKCGFKAYHRILTMDFE